MHTAIGKGWGEFGELFEDNRAAPHQIPRQAAAAAKHDQGSSDHPASRIISSKTLDQHRAAAQAVARALARVSADDQQAPGHAFHLTFERRAEKAAGIASNL